MTKFVEFVVVAVVFALSLAMGSAYKGKRETEQALAQTRAEFAAYKLEVERKHAAALAKALSDHQAQEKIKDEAIKRAEERAAAAEARAVALRRQSVSLRDDLAAANARLSIAGVDALREYAAAANAVLGDCQAEYAAMAEKAEGHAADVRLLKESWPQ